MKPVRCFLACAIGITAATWGCGRTDSAPLTAKLVATERGFTPLEIEAREGVPLRLLVTRQSESSCAKEIIIADAGIRRPLLLGQEVSITFTPARRGELRYTCCDDMAGGRIIVR